MPQFQLALLLGMTVALGPLALDAYLPAFPGISGDLGVPHGDVGLTLSVYVGALGLAQLVGGPLSDRYGRQLILLAGLAVFAAAALMVGKAGSLQEMMAWRVVQGIGGAFCAVSVPAIVRDQFRGAEAARLFGLIGLIMFVAPAAAPSIGTLFLAISVWPAIFVFLAGYALLVGILLHTFLFRRLPAKPRAKTPISTLLTNYLMVVRHPVAMRFIGLQALAFSAMLVFITHASFIYQDWFGLSSTAFSLLFAANVVVMAVVNVANRRLLLRYPSAVLLRVAVMVQACAIAALVACSLVGAPVWAVAGCIIIGVGCMGAIAPNNIANTLEFFPTLGGTAAALLGATQFTFSGGVSALSTVVSNHTLTPIVLVMAACSVLAVILVQGAPAAMRRELDREAEAATLAAVADRPSP